MPLEVFCLTYLDAARWAEIGKWYAALGAGPCLELMRRNVDRECDRQDIDRQSWVDFLDQVATAVARWPGAVDPCAVIDQILSVNHGRYLLAGVPLYPPAVRLYRYMRLDTWVKYNYPNAPVAHLDMAYVARAIEAGTLTAEVMAGTWLGNPKACAWCTLDFLSDEVSANRIRNRLGLQGDPMEPRDCYYLELSYSSSFLAGKGIPLRPPTFLDACLGSLFHLREQSWIFQKNRNVGGGPDWGLTLDLSGGGPGGRGLPEAVHAPFRVLAGEGVEIGLRAISPEKVDCRKVLASHEI